MRPAAPPFTETEELEVTGPSFVGRLLFAFIRATPPVVPPSLPPVAIKPNDVQAELEAVTRIIERANDEAAIQ